MSEVEVPGLPIIKVYDITLASGTGSVETPFQEIYYAIPYYTKTTAPPAETLSAYDSTTTGNSTKKVTVLSSNNLSTEQVRLVVAGRF